MIFSETTGAGQGLGQGERDVEDVVAYGRGGAMAEG
jgi:hypothetical protein